jgi:hypothetical protein
MPGGSPDSSFYPYLAKFDPFLESMRNDSEFTTLMEQLQRRWQALEF